MINYFRDIVVRADKVVVLDGVLLRLHTRRIIDVAILFALSRHATRLWTYAEVTLAKCVLIKTEDASFDLDQVLDYVGRAIINENHCYFESAATDAADPFRACGIREASHWPRGPLATYVLLSASSMLSSRTLVPNLTQISPFS